MIRNDWVSAPVNIASRRRLSHIRKRSKMMMTTVTQMSRRRRPWRRPPGGQQREDAEEITPMICIGQVDVADPQATGLGGLAA